MRSVMRWNATPRRWWLPMAARCLAGQASAQQCRLLLVPAAGAEFEGEDHWSGQCRRRYHQRDQAGRGIRHRRRRPEARGHADVLDRRPGARSQGRRGPELHRTFYWDTNDGTRAFTNASTRNTEEPADHGAGRRYSSLIHYFKALEALGGNPHDGRAVVAKMKEFRPRRRCSARARSAPTAARSTRPISSR